MAFGDEILLLKAEIAELRRIIANMIQIGPVHEVDAKTGTLRLKLGEDANGQPILGPAIPWAESGGAIKTWLPPKQGQTMLALNPVGAKRQGLAINAAFSDENKQPSEKGDENVVTFGPWKIVLDGDALSITGPKVKIKGDIEVAGNADFKDGYVKSNSKHIDDTHGHVSAPPGPPGPPV
ncbi:phage baseplate assembly protein V [Rhodomicrobium lacus]|uniref:phage baseplate assembly protein V n=1 Tax=Rhodomicrobium lacus TaxID=2498452 RepID=UPI000F8D2C3D|nr:phage baseplate assembly protein V [Rhodomicrobium lacus]